MLEKAIIYGIVGLVLTITYSYIGKLTKKQVALNDGGKYRLRMNKLYNIIGYVGIVFGLVMIIGPLVLVTDENGIDFYLFMFFCFLLMSGLGALCVLFYRNHFVEFDEEVVIAQTPLGKMQTMRWDEMRKASFNGMSGFITFKDANNNRLKVHYQLVGFETFLRCYNVRTQSLGINLKLPRHY